MKYTNCKPLKSEVDFSTNIIYGTVCECVYVFYKFWTIRTNNIYNRGSETKVNFLWIFYNAVLYALLAIMTQFQEISVQYFVYHFQVRLALRQMWKPRHHLCIPMTY